MQDIRCLRCGNRVQPSVQISSQGYQTEEFHCTKCGIDLDVRIQNGQPVVVPPIAPQQPDLALYCKGCCHWFRAAKNKQIHLGTHTTCTKALQYQNERAHRK